MNSLSAAQIAEYYDEWTDRYVASFGDVFQACRPQSTDDLIAHVITAAGITDGMRLLDAGCGVGGPSIRIAEQVDVTIEAITISGVQVGQARDRVAQAGLSDRITVRRGDFADLAELFPKNSFDRIIFLESLCHAPDLTPVLGASKKVLTDTGQIYVKDFFRNHLADQADEAWADIVVRRIEQEFRLNVRDVDDVRGAFAASGCTEVRDEAVGLDQSLDRWQAFATANNLDLYAGGEAIEWVDWRELVYTPGRP